MRLLRAIWTLIARALGALVGKLNWQAPPWARFVGGKARNAGSWARGHKGPALGIAFVVAGLGTGGALGWRWYKNRPRPVETEVSISGPELTSLVQDKWITHPVELNFDRSAAPLNAVRKNVTTGIEIS